MRRSSRTSTHTALVGLAVALAITLTAGIADARPNVVTATDTVDDATITLSVLDQTIVDRDIKSWCKLDIDIAGSDVSFSSGDTVELWVRESDAPAGSDDIWHTKFTVTSTQVSDNQVTDTFDCSADFSNDGFGGNLELYAEAEVVKDNCGTFCLYDRPETNNIDSAEIMDDNKEDDDVDTAANGAALGFNRDFIGKDQDWFEFTTTSVTKMTFDVLHRPTVGRLDADLFDDAGSPVGVAVVTDETDRTSIVAEPLPAGTYYVRVTPRQTNNPNFYDAQFAIDNLSTTCMPGMTEDRECGDCGTETRTCDGSGNWGSWGACTDEGECSPGATEQRSCANDGTEERTCSMSCTWDSWGQCMVEPCTNGETRPCYTGTDVTRGIGACSDGTETCTNGVWGSCVDETLPEMEVCDDGVDNDCDMSTDTDDDDCAVGTGELGDVCSADTDCTDWDCIQPPDHQLFVNGYCGRQEACTGTPGQCGPTGICGQVAGTEYCLERCSAPDDCRSDYVCATLDAGDACVPRCRNDSDCVLIDAPRCDLVTGLCIAEGGADMNMGGTDTSMGGTDTSTGGTDTNTGGADTFAMGDAGEDAEGTEGIKAQAGCACRISASARRSETPWTPLAVAVLGLALVGIRRRR